MMYNEGSERLAYPGVLFWPVMIRGKIIETFKQDPELRGNHSFYCPSNVRSEATFI